ncbi:hypothetical protein CYMTET_48247 [Cymbomonas tetramitiformis]|uniref:Thioredoxin domain-containing protein n=1 Tax=Cymbomonas tetramitiformis TaxID=36881 RepID=A0AAE0BUE2_9CHLO|nr:hypothetical protein CYMTET_48247 [Cymbomonas tetramitiformis]
MVSDPSIAPPKRNSSSAKQQEQEQEWEPGSKGLDSLTMTVWCGAVRRGAVRCGAGGAVRCGAVRCGAGSSWNCVAKRSRIAAHIRADRTKKPARLALKVNASRIETSEKWWQKDHDVENLVEVTSTEEFLNILSDSGDKLVIVDFFASWCGACRALYPKIVKTAQIEKDIVFVKVNFDENKQMCKSLGVKVLPFFHFYRGSEGRLAAFSASVSKIQRLRDNIAEHNTARCSLGGPAEELLPKEEEETEEAAESSA